MRNIHCNNAHGAQSGQQLKTGSGQKPEHY